MRSNTHVSRFEGIKPRLLERLNGLVRCHAIFLLVLGTVSCVSVVGAQETYTVLPGDTFSRIARAQGFSLTALLEANPDQGESLQPGDQLRIPELIEFPDLSESTAWEPIDSLFNHEVLAGDTWYGLAKRYDVRLEALRKANPSRDESLQLGTLIRIPGHPAVDPAVRWEQQRSALLERAQSDSTQQATRIETQEGDGSLKTRSFLGGDQLLDRFAGRSQKEARMPASIESDTLHLLAMLPYLLPVDTVLGGDYDAKTKRLREIAMEFTHGMQWGAHMLKDSGFHVQLRLVDTEADSLGVVGWSAADLSWADAVFGPLRRSALDSVAALLAPMGTPQWILTDSPQQWKRYPNTLLIDADREAGMRQLGQLAAQNHVGDTVIVLETKGKDAALEQAFLTGFQEERGTSEGLIVWPATSRFAEGLTALMDTSKLNVVAIPAGASARSMMAYVQTELQLADSFPVRLYANPQSLSYEFMEWDFVDRVQWTLPSDDWMQWEDSLMQVKVRWFKDQYATEPSDYAIRGCDAVLETARWTRLPAAANPNTVRTRFEWKEEPVSGKLRNEAWKFIEFSSGEWHEVDLNEPAKRLFR